MYVYNGYVSIIVIHVVICYVVSFNEINVLSNR